MKRAGVVLICLGLAVMSIVCLAPDDAMITLSGVVRGPDGPVADAYVWTECPPYPGTHADASGAFTLEIKPGCIHEVIVVPPACAGLAQASMRLSGQRTDSVLDVELGFGHHLTGRIVNEAGCPAPVGHDLFASDGRKMLLPFDAHGRFGQIFPPDRYALQLYPPDGSTAEARRIKIDLRENDIEDLVIVYDVEADAPCVDAPQAPISKLGPIVVSGRITGPDGPVPDVHVFVECPPFPHATTDEDGRYVVELDAGCSDVIIARPPLESGLAQASVRLGTPFEDVDLDIELGLGHRLSGLLVNAGGCPLCVNHDLYGSDGRRFTFGLDRDARFDVRLPPDFYRLHLSLPEASGASGQDIPIDLRDGDFEGVLVASAAGAEALDWGVRPGQDFFEDEPAPVAERIVFSPVRDDGTRKIRGETGAMPPGVTNVSLVNLTSGDATAVRVDDEGRFDAELFAPEGAFVYVKYARWNGSFNPEYIRGPLTGTILRAPGNPAIPRDEEEFALSGGMHPDGHWWIEGRMDRLDYAPSDWMTVSGTLTVVSRSVISELISDERTVAIHVELERLTDSEGETLLRFNRGVSTNIAVTGLPIENGWDGRRTGYTPLSLESAIAVGEVLREADRLRIPFSITGQLPTDLPPGMYRPVLTIFTDQPGVDIGYCSYVGVSAGELSGAENNMPFGLPVVSVGEAIAPRVPWMLFCNTFSNGHRGLRAREDEEIIGLSTKVLFPTDGFVLSPDDGLPVRQRLEPFAPTICSSMSEDVEPSPPLIPFDFPSGSLTIVVERPDGRIDTLGPAPFAQSRCGMTEMENAYYISSDRTIMALYELTTLDDAFDYEFDRYGHYVVWMQGSIDDVNGRTYHSAGTYDVYVAEPLDLELAVLPGTPFEIGDAFSPAVAVHPSISADVSVIVRHYPQSDPDRLVRVVFEGTANAYGYFAPEVPVPFVFDVPGEYVADVAAEYWDEQGVLWMGRVRGASVVATPSTPLVARGERGIRSIWTSRPQWFFQRDIHSDGIGETPIEMPASQELLSGMINLPYQSGDVVWIAHENNSLSNELTFQDTVGLVEQFMLGRVDQYRRNGVNCDQDIRRRIGLGEIPFLTTTDVGWDSQLHPEQVDQIGYFYMAVGRPSVGVRNYVAQDGLFRAYWTTDYRYNRQLGTGMEGDRPNDLKYQFGGGVFRLLNGQGPEDDENHYVIHGTIEALVPMDTELGNRTTSPFRGNAGGPDGGALLTLKGEDIDLCILPTAVRPGEILEVGDTFRFAGQIFPAVAAKVTVSVASPSGAVHRFEREANAIGYFYDPSGDTVLTEHGIYEVTVAVLFAGAVSDGHVLPPYPTGGVLGSHEGTFRLYVVDPTSEPIEFTLAAAKGRIPCSYARWPVTGVIPEGLEEASIGHYTVWMAGALLDQGELSFDGDRFTYVFDPVSLHQDFPNLDIGERPGQFPELVDTITLSFLVEADTSDGNARAFAGRIDLQGLDYVVPRLGGG
jgi:hypothetical protein